MEQYCAKCRSLIPAGGSRCEACGELTGDLFDGKIRKPRKPRGGGIIETLIIVILLGAGGWWLLRRFVPAAGPTGSRPSFSLPSTHVASDRPGITRRGEEAKFSEAEAMRKLVRQMVSDGRRQECVAVSSQGFHSGSYRLTAVDSCDHVRLGHFAVDGRSGEVTRAK